MTGGPGRPVVVGVDVGGSGLRLQTSYAGSRGPVHTAPGVRIEPGGIDVAALVASADHLLASASSVAPGIDGAGAGGTGAPSGPDVLVWSMRGLLFLTDRTEVLRTVTAGLGARRTVVVSDAVANLVGALGAVRPGAVVAAGTGAVAFGCDFARTWRRVDGWGHVLGDRGSAAWVGLEGLRSALRFGDGLGGASAALYGAGVDAFGPVETWPRQLMAGADAPERLASFAPAVAGLAATDAAAAGICRRAGAALAESLAAAADGIAEPALSATGGLLSATAVRTAFEATASSLGLAVTAPLGGALDGALTLGAHLLGVGSLPEHPAYLLVG